MDKKIYVIGIGGIGVSAIARYYLFMGWKVFGSDKVDSELIKKLKIEGCDIIIGEDENRLDNNFNLVVYTEAIPQNQIELKKSKEFGIKTLSYPEALASIVNDKKLITIAGTHGKSTTTSLTSLVLKNSSEGVNSIVGTILKEFGSKNTYFSDSPYFVIEACEYKRSFLKYKPTVAVITNIEADHLDYYKDLDDYMLGFKEYIDNVILGGFVILNGEDINCRKLIGLRKNISYIEVYNKYFIFRNEIIAFPEIKMQVPGEHILYDAHIAYIIGHMAGIKNEEIIKSLENYSGVWRRMEIVGTTQNLNTLMSDYGHHPTEIKVTLKALKDANPAKTILTVFQPHQYNRTIELLDDFKTCFYDTDKLIVPDIYESRDSEEDKKKINSKIFVEQIKHPDKLDGQGLENTLKLIEDFDNTYTNSIILLLGAGNVDDLRYKIKTD
ncbi:MAG: UDP-N-acetylmuramate--L-alanine ligase [Candidatus Gracilibacteria bacterium]|nr:UDP-N-acetylmuramate--L-alanine ligase [Candidatus Gracilibacteria bacterium]